MHISPTIIVKKLDGTWRIVIDYYNINKVTFKELYPIPRIEEMFDTLVKVKILTTFDLTSEYWQIHIVEEEKGKTAFIMKLRRWEYNVLWK